MSGGVDRRTAGVVLAALAVGLAVWAVGRWRPGLDGELARDGGRVVPVLYDTDDAVVRALRRHARGLGLADEVRPPGPPDGLPALVLAAGDEPGPGFLPAVALSDGRRAWRPTPDRAEGWRKRAFNALADRLDARLEALPAGRGRVALPARGMMRLELTRAVDPAWVAALLAPGAPSLWLDGRPVADALDVVRAEVRDGRVFLAPSEAARGRLGGDGALEIRLDGAPIARGRLEAARVEGGALLVLPLDDGLSADGRARAAMLLAHGPLPMAVRAGPARAIEPAR